MVACGADPPTDEETPTDTPDAGLPEVTPPLPPAATCKTDGDCSAKGGKCLAVGGGQKACVASKSCTGGDGANSTCGGVAGNETASGTSDCCQTIAVPGGSFNRFNDPTYPAKVSPFLLDAYAEEIPVVLIDDRVHTIWRVDPDRLRTALEART